MIHQQKKIRELLRWELENELIAIVEGEAKREELIKKIVISVCPLVKKPSTKRK